MYFLKMLNLNNLLSVFLSIIYTDMEHEEWNVRSKQLKLAGWNIIKPKTNQLQSTCLIINSH